MLNGPADLRFRKKGFTLIELLVVIAIIAVLVALLLPAVQQAREAARRSSCKNNYKQVALALHNYHETHKVLPMGAAIHYYDAANPNCGRTGVTHGFSWGVHILPFLDQGNMYQQVSFENGPPGQPGNIFGNPANYQPDTGLKAISTYLCPSNPQQSRVIGTPVPPATTGSMAGVVPQGFPRTDMAGVADSVSWMCGGVSPKQFANGVLFGFSRVPFQGIMDGLSNTLLIGEVTGNPNTTVGLNGNTYAGYDVFDTSAGINSSITVPGGGNFAFRPQGFSSFHVGGSHFAMCDGSVRFISQNLNRATLQALATRKGKETVGEF